MKTIEQQLEEVIENIGQEHSVLRYVYNNGKKFVPGVSPVYYSGPYFKGNEEIIQATKTLLTGAWLSSGEEVRKFEIAFSKKINQKNGLMVNSGSSANLVMIAATKKRLNWEDGGEIITSVVGFPTTVAPIVQNNLVPVFVDIEMGSLNFDLNLIEDKITEKTKAIFVSPVLGNPPDMDKIVEICTRRNLVLLLDDCDSLGSKWNGLYLNEYAYASSVSFYPSHHMSCSYNTKIPYLDEHDNFNFDTIENLYNKYVSIPNKLKILSFDSDGKINWTSPYDIIRHEVDRKEMYKITTILGRTIEVTNDHSVFVMNEDFDIIPKKVDELVLGDYIVSSRRLPLMNKNISIDLIDMCKKIDVDNFTVSDFPSRYLKNVDDSDSRYDYKLRNSLSIQYIDKDYTDIELSNMKISISQGKYKIPCKLDIDNDICRLIGYYLAEGSYNTRGLVISLHEKELDIIEDIRDICVRRFGLDISVITSDNKGVVVKIYSSVLRILFENYFNIKTGARNKRIPTQMFELNESCIKSFVYAYCRGDGSECIKPRNVYIDVTSVSKTLLEDLQYLLSFIGVSGSFCVRNHGSENKIICGKSCKSSDNYTLTISGFVNDYVNKTIIRHDKFYKSNTLDSMPINKKLRSLCFGLAKTSKIVSRKRVIKLLKQRKKEIPNILENDLSFFKVRKIEKISYDNMFVYDFAVKNNENFYGGDFGIFLHNTTAQGGMVVSNDKELMRIARSFAWWSRSCTCVGAGNLLPNGACGNRFDKWLPDYDGVIDHKYVFETMGYNLQPLDLQGSIGLVQLKNLDEVHEKRSMNKKRIGKCLIDNLDVHVPEELEYAETSWFGVPIVCETREYKERLVAYLEDKKIQTRHYFSGNLLLHPGYKHLGNWKDYPEANKVLSHVFFIGCTPQYTEEILQYIESVIKDFK